MGIGGRPGGRPGGLSYFVQTARRRPNFGEKLRNDLVRCSCLAAGGITMTGAASLRGVCGISAETSRRLSLMERVRSMRATSERSLRVPKVDAVPLEAEEHTSELQSLR